MIADTPEQTLRNAALAVNEAIDARNRLAAQLLDAGMTSRHLAEVVGVTHQTIRNWAEAWR